MHITREALKRFDLDRVWWLVSPGNPLKEHGPAPLPQRMAHAQMIMQHPRVVITDIEARLGSRYTAETLSRLFAFYPAVRFVWLMGADNLAQFHQWQQWRQIARRLPIGVLARPGNRISARTSVAARAFSQARLSGRASQLLGRAESPAWCFVNMPMLEVSSSAIRSEGRWHV